MDIQYLAQTFIDDLHEQANQINNIYDDISSMFDAYGRHEPSASELKPLYDECDRIYAICDSIIQNSISAIHREQKKHGGARSGSGRKKLAPTKQIRVDENLAGSFKSISDAYRSLDSEGQIELLRLLRDSFSSKTNL